MESFKPNLVAGHPWGIFSFVASGALNFEDGLKLVSIRVQAMQNHGKPMELWPLF